MIRKRMRVQGSRGILSASIWEAGFVSLYEEEAGYEGLQQGLPEQGWVRCNEHFPTGEMEVGSNVLSDQGNADLLSGR